MIMPIIKTICIILLLSSMLFGTDMKIFPIENLKKMVLESSVFKNKCHSALGSECFYESPIYLVAYSQDKLLYISADEANDESADSIYTLTLKNTKKDTYIYSKKYRYIDNQYIDIDDFARIKRKHIASTIQKYHLKLISAKPIVKATGKNIILDIGNEQKLCVYASLEKGITRGPSILHYSISQCKTN